MIHIRKYSMHMYMYFYYTAIGVFAPFLGFWFAEQGLTNQQIGLLYSVGPVLGLITQPLWGTICDRFGAERKVLVACFLLAPLFAFGYLFGNHFFVFVITAALLATFSTPLGPIGDAMAVNHAQEYKQSYGSIRVLGSLSFAIAVTPIGMLYSRFGMEYIFFAYLVAMLACLCIIFALKKPTIQKRSIWKGIQHLLAQKGYLFFLLLILVGTIGSQFFNIFFSVYVTHMGGDVSQKIGILNTIAALSELPFFILSSALLKRFGYPLILAFCALAASFRWFVLALEPSFTVLMFSQVLHGITYALFFAAGVNYAYQMSPNEAKTTGQTIFSIVYINMANIIASNAGGWMTDTYGFSASFHTVTIISLISAVGFLILWILQKRQQKSQIQLLKMQ